MIEEVLSCNPVFYRIGLLLHVLGVLASYELKIAKNLQLLDILACNSSNATFKTSLQFLHLWSIGQKGFVSYFEKLVY